ncbi:MAG: sulfotransferase domain-containing protein [Chloroflexota bacterium]
MTKTLSRPNTFEDYKTRFEGMFSEESHQIGLNFQPHPTDVIITPFSKSGTTWLQQIVHGLRSRGDMDFDDISRVVPWLGVSHDLGIDINAPQRWQPRAFKSHSNWQDVPKGGRYIVSIRDPRDVLVSLYRFSEGWFFEPGSISIEEYADDEFFTPEAGKGYWHHLLSWWSQRDNEQVLLLSFEWMKTNLEETVQRVADFIGVELDDALFELVVHQASFGFMLAHKDRFDDKLLREWSEAYANLPSDSDASKVRAGQVGSYKRELTAVLQQKLDTIWQQTVQPALGFATYEDFQKALVKRSI